MQIKSIKLISYNVRLFNYYEWDKKENVRDSILNYLKKRSPDIICFQDFLVRNEKPKQSIYSINEYLSELPYHYFETTNGKAPHSQYGIATYSRYPIAGHGKIEFENSFNSCIYTDLIIQHDTMRVYNVHLQSIKLLKPDYYFMDSLVHDFNKSRITEAKDISGRLKLAYIKRAQQVEIVKTHMHASPYPVVLCGDFNDTPVSYTYNQLGGNLEDAFLLSGKGFGNTYRGNLPSFRIDYIFHSPSLVSDNFVSEKLKLSDHYPTECELLFKYQLP